MEALICKEPRRFEYADIQQPQLQPGYAIIKVKRVGICGTDLHAFEGTQPFFSYPRILGHEVSGELVDVSNATGFQTGELVTFIPYFNCGACIACRTGKPNCCAQLMVCGVHADGAMLEYLTVPSSSLLHGAGLSVDALALVEPLSIGAHGIRRANIKADEFVLVVGAGPIGLTAMEFAKLAGAKVIALDVNEHRLQFCTTELEIQHTIYALKNNVIERLEEITNGDMPSVVIDATGNLNAINEAFQYMAHGARYVLIGLQRENISISHPEFHKREGTLMSSRNALRQDFEQVIACIKAEQINPLKYITHRVQFNCVKDEFEKWLNPANRVIKAMVEIA